MLENIVEQFVWGLCRAGWIHNLHCSRTG